MKLFAFGALCALLLVPHVAVAHPGHSHGSKKTEKKQDETVHPIAFRIAKDVDGQGVYRFRYVPQLSTLPVDDKVLLKAHGGFGIDRSEPNETRETTFGLPGVGLLRISPDLKEVKVIGGEGFDVNQNPHNTHVFSVGGEKRIALPSDSAGKVWITDYQGKLTKEIGPPPNSGFRPTDAVLAKGGKDNKEDLLFVPSGYGDKVIYAANPLDGTWSGTRWGGQPLFSTSHGITVNPRSGNLVVANREDGQLFEFTSAGKLLWMLNLEQTPHPCDVDFSDDGSVAVVGCLRGPGGGNATFHILKDGVPVSKVCPADLGVPNSRHIHNAALRFVKQADGNMKMYVLCLFWNPGGYAVFEQVIDDRT